MLNNIIPFDNESEDSLFVFFNLGEKSYALNASHTIELMKMPLLEHPQSMPKHIIGVLNYNNLTINIVDLRSILDGSKQKCDVDSQLMIVKTEETIFGLAIDSVSDVVAVPTTEMRFPPYTSEKNVIKMMYPSESKLVSILDLYAIETVLKEDESSEDNFNYEDNFPVDEKSRKIMRARTENIVAKTPENFLSVSYNQDQFVVFNLEDSSYCINMRFVKEIVSASNVKITNLPYSPHYVDGVINLRGDFTTIINLKRFIATFGDESSSAKKILVIDSKEYKVALSVDEVIGIKSIDSDQFVHRASNKLEPKYTMAEFVEDEKIYYILNVEKILNDEKLFISVE